MRKKDLRPKKKKKITIRCFLQEMKVLQCEIKG